MRPNPTEDGFSVSPGSSASVALSVQTCRTANATAPTATLVPSTATTTRTTPTQWLAASPTVASYTSSRGAAACRRYFRSSSTTAAAAAATATSIRRSAATTSPTAVTGTSTITAIFAPTSTASPARRRHPTRPLVSVLVDFYRRFIVDRPDRDALKAYDNLRRYNATQIVAGGLVERNFVRVDVYVQTPLVDEYVQRASYEFANFASDVGGTFGLWIGMSVISWCEVAQLVVDLVYIRVSDCLLVARRRRRRRRRRNGDEEIETNGEGETK